jgi:hypothetical protein
MSTELESGAVVLLETIAGENAQKDTNMASENGAVIELDTDKGRKDPDFIHMPLTPELLAAARAKAGANVALGPWLQEYLAEQLGVTLPVKTDKRVRYTGPDAEVQREAARKRSIAKAADTRKYLLAIHKARKAGNAAEVKRLEALLEAVENS